MHVPGSSTCRISNDDSLNFVEKSLSYAAYGQLFEYDDKIFSSTTMWDNSFNLKKQWTMGYNFNNNAVSGCVNKNGVYFVYNSLIINTTDLENIRVMNHYMSSSNTTLTKDVSYGDVHCFLTSSNAYGLDENGYVKYVNNNTSNRLFYDLFVTPDGIFGIGASLYHTSNGINWVTSSLGVSNTSKLFYINGTYYITNGSTIRKGTYNDIMNNTHKNISGVSHNYSYSDGKNIVFCSDTTAYIYDFKTDSCVPVLRNASSIKSVAHTDKKYFIFDTGVVHVFNNDFNYIKTVTCPITLTNVISFDNNIFGKNNNNYYSFNENGDCLSIGSSPSNSELRCYEDGIYFVSNGCKIKCELINQGIVLPKLEEYSYIKAL